MKRVLMLAVCGLAAAIDPVLAAIQFNAPTGWTAQPPSSSMRHAQWLLPKAAGEPEDATAVIFFFGQGEGGSVADNLDRWASQMVQTGGKPGTAQQAKTTTFSVGGVKVTTLDLSGAYAGGMGSGQAASAGRSRMKAAVVETSAGNYFVRVLGGEKTIARWETAIDAFFKSFRE
ncbi:MAG: hypothetical protein AB7I50_00025 [Vicinamibacterales bacterium]